MLVEFRYGNNFIEILDLENVGVETMNVYIVQADIWHFTSFSTMATGNGKDAGEIVV
jgi:hypothetical protein